MSLSNTSKLCSRCHQTFDCLAEAIETCHCSKIELNELERNHIREKFADCLCGTCLEAIKIDFFNQKKP